MSRKRIVILGHMGKGGIAEQIDALRGWFDQRAEVLGIHRADTSKVDEINSADLCVVFGGDGTLLTAARNLAQTSVPLLGVNMGKLGFLAEFSIDDLQRHFDDILAGRVAPTERLMLDVCLTKCDDHSFCSTAVNDVAIQAGEPYRMIALTVAHDGVQVSEYLGDGIVISTPTGSTAYNLSLGGPIIEPSLNAVTMTPIAPHTLSLRPIVLPADATIKITAARVNRGTAIIIDGQATTGICDGDTIDIRRAAHSARIIRCPDRSFFETLTNKLHWGRGPYYNSQKKPRQ